MKVKLLIVGIVCFAALFFYQNHWHNSTPESTVQTNKPIWTPEMIVDDPRGYTAWALAEISTALKTIDTNLSGIQEQIAQNNRSFLKAVRQHQLQKEMLEASQEAYKRADERNQWPAKLAGQGFSKKQLKKRIVEVHAASAISQQEKDQRVTFHDTVSAHSIRLEELQTRLLLNKTELEQKLHLMQLDSDVTSMLPSSEIESILSTVQALNELTESSSIESLIHQNVSTDEGKTP